MFCDIAIYFGKKIFQMERKRTSEFDENCREMSGNDRRNPMRKGYNG